MNITRVVLAVRPRLYRELLATVLSRETDVRVIALNTDDEFVVANALQDLLERREESASDPVFVVVSIEDIDGVPPICARLLWEFPEVTIIGIHATTARIRLFQLRIDDQDFPGSVSGLLMAVRECTRHLPPL